MVCYVNLCYTLLLLYIMLCYVMFWNFGMLWYVSTLYAFFACKSSCIIVDSTYVPTPLVGEILIAVKSQCLLLKKNTQAIGEFRQVIGVAGVQEFSSCNHTWRKTQNFGMDRLYNFGKETYSIQ